MSGSRSFAWVTLCCVTHGPRPVTCSPYTPEEVAARIAQMKAVIAAYWDAILFLGANPKASYSLDTGQTRQTVQYANLTSLRDTLNSLENQLAVFVARHCCGGSVIARPAY